MNNRLKMAGVAGALVAVMAVGGTSLAFNQVSTAAQATTSAGAAVTMQISNLFDRGGPDAGIFDRTAQDAVIAKALGITTDELSAARTAGTTVAELAKEKGVAVADIEAAVEAARTAAINQAVTDGTITQAQADAMLSRQAPPAGDLGFKGDRGPDAGIFDSTAANAVIAKALGITTDELSAARTAGTTVAELAKEKNVAVADIEAAVQAARTDAINQAVTAGTITQAQADAMLSRQAPLGLDGLGPMMGDHGPDAGIFDNSAADAAIAQALGITTDELSAARTAGTSVAQLAKEKGVAVADIEAAVQAARTAAVNQAVTDGTITQAQADAMLSRQPQFELGGFGPMGGRGGRGGHGGPGGMPFGDPNAQPPASAPSTTPSVTPSL